MIGHKKIIILVQTINTEVSTSSFSARNLTRALLLLKETVK
jgi:hypothetical protein